MISAKKKLNRKSSLYATFVAIFAIFLIILGLAGYYVVKRETKNNIKNLLQLNLSANLTALKSWVNDKKQDAETIASEPQILQAIYSIMEIPKTPNLSDIQIEKKLKESDELKLLRKRLDVVCKLHGFLGFVLLNEKGLQVAALFQDPIGKKGLIEQSSFFKLPLQDKTIVSHPFIATIDLPDKENKWLPNQPTMFVSTPIKSATGKIIGVLSFRMRPEESFSKIMQVSRFGKTGETYAFNKNGVMLTDSRFNAQLKRLKLIPSNNNSRSILEVKIQVPAESTKKNPSITNNRFTLLAESALRGETKDNVEGYLNYRGVLVVGAWAWITDFDFGIGTEIEYQEAFSLLRTLLIIFFLFFILLVIASLIAFNYRNNQIKVKNELAGINLQLERKFQEAQSAKKALSITEFRAQTIVENLIEGIITIDSNGIIKSFNSAALKMFGYSRKEIIGKNVNILTPEPHKSLHDNYIKNYLETKIPKMIGLGRQLEAVKKDNSAFPIDISISETVLNNEHIFTGIIRDQTQYMRAEEAERANQAKSEFLSRMSHELRTPLNAIIGFSEVIFYNSREPLSSSQKKNLNHILKASQHLLELINDILDLSRIDSGKIRLSLEPINLSKLIKDLSNLVCPMAEKEKVQLRLSEIDLDIFVLGDKTRLKQSILNLLSNAIKYNRPSGQVSLNVKQIPDNKVVIEVSDTGIGIPNESFDDLFKPFNRLGADRSEIEGTGIGLAITKKLVELMNGAINVESELGKGSQFFIEIPAVDPPIPTTNETNPKNQKFLDIEMKEKSFTILYVEDNSANLELVKQILSEFAHIEILSTPDGKIGLDLAKAHIPDLILLDINLPGISGIEVVKFLKNFEETRNIPVIAISANAMESDIQRALGEGFDAYITKPIRVKDFLKRLEPYLQPV